MASILKVDTLQKPDGSTPTATDLGIDVAGSVVQVQQVTQGNQTSFSNSSGDIGLAITVTPKYASSRMMVMVDVDGITFEDDGDYGRFRLNKNGSMITSFAYPLHWSSVDNASGTTASTTYLDSPLNSTNSVTYSVYWDDYGNNCVMQVNRDGALHCSSKITVLEIAQ